MTIAGESISEPLEAQSRPREDLAVVDARDSPAAGADAGGWSRLPVSAVALSAAFGVLVVAAADAAGRLGHSGSVWAVRAYWLGQALILVPAAARLLSRRVRSSVTTLTIIVLLTVAEYLVKVCYSPAAFTFPDELQHWRGTVNILQTGTLSSPNYLLPISPHYPGLEEVTSALAATTGLGVFTSGLIVVGIAHLLFVCLLYALFRHVAGSHRLAGVAVAFYVGNSHFQSFDSMFAYQTLAVTFFALALLAVWRLATADGAGWSRGWLAIAGLAILATAMTHHVTSYMLVTALVVITVTCVLTGNRRSARWPAILALLSTVTVAAWVLFAAPGTVSYLGPVAAGVLRGFGALLTGGHSGASSVSAGRSGTDCWPRPRCWPSRLCCRSGGGGCGERTGATRGSWRWPSARSAGMPSSRSAWLFPTAANWPGGHPRSCSSRWHSSPPSPLSTCSVRACAGRRVPLPQWRSSQ